MYPGRGYWVLASGAVTLEIRNQGPPPTVNLAAPADLAVITEPTEITGIVESDRLQSWILTSRPIGDGDSVTLATGTAPIASSILATFDPTLLLNGLYELELIATDVQGQQVSESIAVSVEGQMKIGHFTLSFVDLQVPVSGLDIEIVRSYDSRDRKQRDFGVGWRLDLRQGSYRNNRPPGDGWQLQTGSLPCDSIVESKSHLTVVRLSDRELYRFALELTNGVPSTGGGCYAEAAFEYVDGPVPGARLEILGPSTVFWGAGSNEVLDLDTLAVFEPRSVRLTTRDLRVFDLDLDVGVTRIEDADGNQLTITAGGLFHSDDSVEFVRDAEGRIVSIADPMGREIRYKYDPRADLVETVNRAGDVTRFVYDADHRIEEIIDPRGIQAVRNEYDPDGRLIKVTDALGHSIGFQHDLDNRREVTVNRLGLAKTFEYDNRGNVLVEIDEGGHATTFTYDAKDRPLTVTNALGRVMTNTYDPDGNLASVRDPQGHTTSFTHDPQGNVLTVVDPLGQTTTHTYSTSGNRLTTRDPLGNESHFTYDGAGNLTGQTDPTGATTDFVYDGRGQPTRIVNPLGHETRLTRDAAGNLIGRTTSRTLPDGSTESLTTAFVIDELGRRTETVHPDGSSSRTAYDFRGAILSTEDALGRLTRFTYDLMGRPTGTLFADGSADSRIYDAEGRVLSATDRAGKTTSYVYDPGGRLLTTTFPDGSSASSTYDAVDQLLTSTDPRGATTSYVYDAAGRQTEVVDAFGNSTLSDRDAAGHQVAVTDPLGRETRFEYDAGRLTRTILPDGQEIGLEYDAIGRRIAEVDQAGRRTEMAYDAAGRMVQITDALGGVTRYAFDQEGNLLSQIDAGGHQTRFEYDALGRQVARVLADGARESFVYDAGGRKIRHTDFNGATTYYAYDDNDRLVQRTHPDGGTVDFSYTLDGRRSAVTDARGTTTYEYDDRGRLFRQTVPEGYELRYAWDASGNRTALAVELAGGTIRGSTFTYDALDRLQTVTDSRGGVYAYAYDAAGSRQSLSYPNGVVTNYVYDDLRRLLEIRTENPQGEVLAALTYQRGVTGHLQAVTDQDGTMRTYAYDPLYQVTEERVTDGAGAVLVRNTFTYDLVGNRLGQERTAADGSVESVAYAYDGRGRLLSEVSGLRNVAYGWDADGNRVSRSGTGADGSDAGASYSWGAENRLVGVELADGTAVAHRYDFDGTWLGRVVSGGSDPGEEGDRGWVVDQASALSQVVGQLDGAGALEAEYPRAAELLGLLQVGAESYAHGDKIGSVIALTDPSAAVVQRRDYEAFGAGRGTDPGFPSPFRFAGEQHDGPTGLYYLRARWLDPEVGSLLSIDPLAHQPNLLRYMPYSYADQDPINKIDPSGKSPAGLVAIGITVAIAVGLAVSSAIISHGRLGGLGSQNKKIRPMILVDLKRPWTDSEVNIMLSHGRSLLQERAGFSYTWDPKNIRRLVDHEVTGNKDGQQHMIPPNIETEAAAQNLIYNIWLESPNTYAVIFVSSLNFEQQTNGTTPIPESAGSWTGSLIARRGLTHKPELVVGHELVHGFGGVRDIICSGAFGYLMSKGPKWCGFGRKLTGGQVTALRTNSLAWR